MRTFNATGCYLTVRDLEAIAVDGGFALLHPCHRAMVRDLGPTPVQIVFDYRADPTKAKIVDPITGEVYGLINNLALLRVLEDEVLG